MLFNGSASAEGPHVGVRVGRAILWLLAGIAGVLGVLALSSSSASAADQPQPGALADVSDAAGHVVGDAVDPVAQPTAPVVESRGDTVGPANEPMDTMVEHASKPGREPVESKVGPVRKVAEPVRKAVEPVRKAVEPVGEPVRKALEPVTEPVRTAVEPITRPISDPVFQALAPAIPEDPEQATPSGSTEAEAGINPITADIERADASEPGHAYRALPIVGPLSSVGGGPSFAPTRAPSPTPAPGAPPAPTSSASPTGHGASTDHADLFPPGAHRGVGQRVPPRGDRVLPAGPTYGPGCTPD